jgi:hypothetical protein
MVLPKELVAAHDDIQPGARSWFYMDFDYSREGELPFVFHRNPDLDGLPLQFAPSGEAVILGLGMVFEKYEHDIQDYVGDYYCHTFSAADVAGDDSSVPPDATVFVIDLRQPNAAQ